MIKFPDISSEYLQIIDTSNNGDTKRNSPHFSLQYTSTHIFSHNYDNYVLYSKLYLVNNFLTYFVLWTILAITDHMQEHIFPDFACFPWLFPDHS